ncbi:hypothetical protein ACFY64_11280 [Streptomyces collinus]|uniref:hypothetical protein n=1 Tax=Streptomyces collinus TaxID=42684 RepID=UPI0036CFBE57
MATVQLDTAEAGVASAAYNTVQQVGAAFGTALLKSIATSVTTPAPTRRTANSPPGSGSRGDRLSPARHE